MVNISPKPSAAPDPLAASTRLDDAIEIANAVAGLGEKSIWDPDALARIEAAIMALDTASRLYGLRNGSLLSPAWLRLSARRDVFREIAAGIRSRCTT